MKAYPAQELRDLGARLFTACGAPQAEAAVVADHLVEASLMGIDSHGVVRFVMYVEHCLDGFLRPGAPVGVARDAGQVLVVDCGLNFGQVGAYRMTEMVAERARTGGLAFCASRACHHVGRLGAYPQRLAEAGLFGLAVASSPEHGHFVVPWGGRQGRLATNPLAWAAPTGGRPILLDMSTSMTPEGKIRTALHAGEALPPGRILDAAGQPSTDPAAFYGPPRGVILPFGGDLGYRGYGLGLLVEVLGRLLAGEPPGGDARYINAFGLLAIDPAASCGSTDAFTGLADHLCGYVKGSEPAPGSAGVLMPGEREFRMLEARARDGIPLPAETVRQIRQVGERVGVRVGL